MRSHSPFDQLISRADAALRAATRTGLAQHRAMPGADLPDPPLAASARRRAAGMMRVNHAGEICAQALYVGQALLARDPNTHDTLLRAAAEEGDHLYWCEQRLRELGGRASWLNPLWFVGSYAIGVAAAAAGDHISLGFVEETERQVVRHLDTHLGQLPDDDRRSRALVAAMRADEARHADAAAGRGAAQLPWLVKFGMGMSARVLTTLAYWL